MSLTQTLKGVGIMTYPIVVQLLVDLYGFRGAALAVAGIHANAFFAMIVMHPVEWHYKTIKVPVEEEEGKEEERQCNYLFFVKFQHC